MLIMWLVVCSILHGTTFYWIKIWGYARKVNDMAAQTYSSYYQNMGPTHAEFHVFGIYWWVFFSPVPLYTGAKTLLSTLLSSNLRSLSFLLWKTHEIPHLNNDDWWRCLTFRGACSYIIYILSNMFT